MTIILLGYECNQSQNKTTPNSQNGRNKKTLKTRLGRTTPRDRNGTFEPEINKILALYTKGLSTRDISESLSEIYGFEASHETISNVTDQVIPHVKEWQQHPLNFIYPIVYLDALHVKMKDVKGAQNRAIYCIIAIYLERHKDVLSISIGENESASYWMGLLDELKARGVEDICIACVDGLSGFKQAIQAVFPIP